MRPGIASCFEPRSLCVLHGNIYRGKAHYEHSEPRHFQRTRRDQLAVK